MATAAAATGGNSLSGGGVLNGSRDGNVVLVLLTRRDHLGSLDFLGHVGQELMEGGTTRTRGSADKLDIYVLVGSHSF